MVVYMASVDYILKACFAFSFELHRAKLVPIARSTPQTFEDIQELKPRVVS